MAPRMGPFHFLRAARCVSRAASAVNAGNYADQVRGMASQLLLEHRSFHRSVFPSFNPISRHPVA